MSQPEGLSSTCPLYFDAFTRFGPRKGKHPRHPWTLDHLIDELRHCSISAAMVATTRQLLYNAMFENRRLCEHLKPHEHLFPIWNVLPHWSGDFAEPDELERLMAQHDIRCVTIHPETNRWEVRSSTSRPLLEVLERTRTLTIVDAPNEVSWQEVEYLAETYPELPILLRQVRWGNAHSVIPLVRNYKSLHLTFESFQINRGLEFFVEYGCLDQLVFSSNAPEMAAGCHRAYVDWAELDDASKAKIAGGNLTRLLKGLAPPREVVNEQEDEYMAACRQGRPLPGLVLDMHAHILDEGLHSGDSGYPMLEGGPSGVHHQAQRMGVDGIGVMSWNGTVGADAADGNRCVRAALDAYPDFYWGLATFDVLHESPQAMRAQMEAIYADSRFLGLKPYPSYGVPYDDPRYDAWWQFGNERGLYAGFHPVKWYKRDEFASVCERFPNLTVVAYHCGGSYDIADTVIELARTFDNFMIEPTLTPCCGGIIDYLVEHAGADRVMYGSDLPMRDPRQQLGWVMFSRLSPEVKRKVLGENAQRLLERVRTAQAGVVR